MHMAKQSQQLVLMLIIGILIGTAGVMAWKTRTVGEGDDISMATTNSGAQNASDTLALSGESLSHAPSLPLAPAIPKGTRLGINVQDQLAGVVVTVEGLNISATQWLAVYEERDGQPGNIIGAVRAHAGDSEAKVELLRPTVQGQKYFVGILNDDGSETFNRQTDLPPLSPDKVVIVSFNAL